MTHSLAALRDFLRPKKTVVKRRSCPTSSRNVIMHVTLDAQHASPVRQALVRDCAGHPWTIRLVRLQETGRMRLSLYLPKEAVNGAIQRVTHLAPSAEVGQLFEIPESPTHAWRNLMHSTSAKNAEPHHLLTKAISENDSPAPLFARDDIYIDLDIASREALFVWIGEICEERYGLQAVTVVASLNEREALGSTGLGLGVAVPHGRIDGLRSAVTLYIRPIKPIAFDAPDGKPVSDVVVLLVPESASNIHLQLLAEVAQQFCDHHFRELLHGCADAHAAGRLFTDYQSMK